MMANTQICCLSYPILNRNRWRCHQLTQNALSWKTKLQKHLASLNSPWWTFMWSWQKTIHNQLKAFIAGDYRFSPMTQYRFSEEVIRIWSYSDRLMIHLLLNIIKPTFKHIISSKCLHLIGPSAIRGATARIKAALSTQEFQYSMRIDMRSYYASIDHPLLMNQLEKHFNDPILLKYFKSIIEHAVDYNGNVFLPQRGIPTRSALSPFFGALYLDSLDRAFSDRRGIFYLRYMDDVIILLKTKRQYLKARKQLFTILKELRLQISPRKTRMGRLRQGFHFLGVNFEVSRNPQGKIQETKVDIHRRTTRRALDKVMALRNNAVHPAHIQRYLTHWATWWHFTMGKRWFELIKNWNRYAESTSVIDAWGGRGLLLGYPSNIDKPSY